MGYKETVKARWASADTIAKKINRDKSNVYNCLTSIFATISNLDCESWAIGEVEEAQKIVDDRYAVEGNKPKLFNPRSRNIAEDMKLAFWFIDKIGDPDRALLTVQQAVEAMKKLEGKTNEQD